MVTPTGWRDQRRDFCYRTPGLDVPEVARGLYESFFQTGNTEKVARAIFEVVLEKGHEVDLKAVGEITPAGLDDYDLVFLGSACHSADLAQPVKQVLERVDPAPSFKLAGFATHATFAAGGDPWQQELHGRWASKCIRSFQQASEQKQIVFLGYFSCQGAPSAPIEVFIRNTIITDDAEWETYIENVKKRPDERDLRNARSFAEEMLTRC
jgi:flavodoxin